LPADDVSRVVPRTPFLYFLCGLVEISSNRFSRHPFCAVREGSRSSPEPLVFTLFAFAAAPGIHFAEFAELHQSFVIDRIADRA